MSIADLAYAATRVAEILLWIIAAFVPGLLLATAYHLMRRRQNRRAWAATCRTVAADYRQEQPLLDAAADIVNTYADRITPLYGKGE
ncbi:hypothetical protein [Streptomyces microflavus]|uniref:hypothetical protein n=1 Tax=Streptomyces microflavus TaxID=1919 RepID=UPI002E345359|nr:hypothetical protein [Streptomyces microflavus]